jgi:hypothetical protein
MATINFPSSPVIGDLHTQNNQTWRFDGVIWTSAQGATVLVEDDIGTLVEGYDPNIARLDDVITMAIALG